ncbi:hypothetical protein ADIARSV_3847 [Arcticibacter svalbardensis MN12-7]|uniref:Uncharacterized protein n=1 Tax=Arcticibacter svalbardensis MN12-7 TaxID=1150600 RepID=R9GN77_9SPHI|nr:hypothetical protein ADIARSV_3847 [Arcticibacter svalbardensis MN12-7]
MAKADYNYPYTAKACNIIASFCYLCVTLYKKNNLSVQT